MTDNDLHVAYSQHVLTFLQALEEAVSKSESEAVREALRRRVTDVGASIVGAGTALDLYQLIREVEIRMQNDGRIRRYANHATFAREQMLITKMTILRKP